MPCQHQESSGLPCSKRAEWGLTGGHRTRCTTHKEPGMVDLNNRRCCDHPDGCSKQPNFGLSGSPAIRCATHKEPGMVNVHYGQGEGLILPMKT